MVNRERKIIEVPATSVDIDYGKLGDALTTIKNLIKIYGPDARLDYYTPPYSDDDTRYLYVYEKRLENDNEYMERITLEKQYESMLEKREYDEYVRLKKKFGKVDESIL